MTDRKFEVIKECVLQDNHKRYYPGDVMENISNMEFSRHIAEGNIVPQTKAGSKRTRLKQATEKRLSPLKQAMKKRGSAKKKR